MEDLSAASHEDVQEFFRTYYAPNNASLVIAGDIDFATTRAMVERWFSDVPGGKPVPPVAPPRGDAHRVTRKTVTDRVQLPRLYLAWLTPGADAARRRRARRRCVAAHHRQELAALQAAGLRAADRPGRDGLPAVAGARQRVLPAGDGPPRQDRRGAAEGDRRGDRASWRRRRPSRARWSGCSTRSRRRSCARPSASAASAARPTS